MTRTAPRSPPCPASPSCPPEPAETGGHLSRPSRAPRPPRSAHAERGLVHLQHRLFLGDVVLVALAERDDLAYHLGVRAAPSGLGHDLLLLDGDVLLLRLLMLVAFDELPQLVGGDILGGVGQRIGHGHAPLKIGPLTSGSSPAVQAPLLRARRLAARPVEPHGGMRWTGSSGRVRA